MENNPYKWPYKWGEIDPINGLLDRYKPYKWPYK